MTENGKVKYAWTNDFKDKVEAVEVAGYFHEVLKGNPDYEYGKIMIYVGEFGCVDLYEFEGSKTHVNVVIENDRPILELFEK